MNEHFIKVMKSLILISLLRYKMLFLFRSTNIQKRFPNKTNVSIRHMVATQSTEQCHSILPLRWRASFTFMHNLSKLMNKADTQSSVIIQPLIIFEVYYFYWTQAICSIVYDYHNNYCRTFFYIQKCMLLSKRIPKIKKHKYLSHIHI